MMTELVLVEGVSDVQLISYYLQNVYGWKHKRDNTFGIIPLDEHEYNYVKLVLNISPFRTKTNNKKHLTNVKISSNIS